MSRSGPFQDSKGRWREPNGRFMKVASAVAAAEKAVGRKQDGGKSGTLAGVSAKVAAASRRDDRLERTFASAARASRGTKMETTAKVKAAPPKRDAAIHAQIRDSVARHANSSGWASVADVRDDLAASGVTGRAEQDAALRSMLKQPNVRIVPIADTKNLGARERDGALWMGGEPNPAIRVTPEAGQVVDANDIGRTSSPHPPTTEGAQSELDRAIARYEDLYGPDRSDWPASARATVLALEARGAKTPKAPKPKRGNLATAGAKLASVDGPSTDTRGGSRLSRPEQALRQDSANVRPEVYDGTEPPARRTAPPSPQQVFDIIREIQLHEDSPVYISYVRQRMGGTRAQQDEVFRQMARDRSVFFYPEEAQMALADADDEAAVFFGGEAKHKIQTR